MESQITFPVLAFWASREPDGSSAVERFRAFIQLSDLREASQRELKLDERVGMVLADSSGQCWTILKAWSIGYCAPRWRRILQTLLNDGDNIRHHVRHEIEAGERTPFPEVQERVCRAIDGDPEAWMDDEVLAGESGPPLLIEDVLNALKAAVRRAATVQEILDGLDPEQHYPALQAAAAAEYDREA